MSSTFEKIEAEIHLLSFEEKMRLVHQLISEIDDIREDKIESLWIAEAERRQLELLSGKSKAIPASEVFQKIQSRLNRSIRPEI
jgi:putative addiction module component (TIGR02574 family)